MPGHLRYFALEIILRRYGESEARQTRKTLWIYDRGPQATLGPIRNVTPARTQHVGFRRHTQLPHVVANCASSG